MKDIPHTHHKKGKKDKEHEMTTGQITLLQHPSVIECCVLGLPDKDYGERVCAIIVLQPNSKATPPDDSKPTMSLDELRTWAKDKLAPYKV